MLFLPSIPDDAKVPHVLALFSDRGSRAGRALFEFHEALLRGESPFTVPQREMMAAFVSGINACEYCYGARRRPSSSACPSSWSSTSSRTSTRPRSKSR